MERRTGRITTIADSKHANPRTSVAWRHLRARYLASKKYLRRLAVDDGVTYRAAPYYRLKNRLLAKAVSGEQLEQRMREHDAGMHVAQCIETGLRYRFLRRSVKRRMLAGQNDQESGAISPARPAACASAPSKLLYPLAGRSWTNCVPEQASALTVPGSKASDGAAPSRLRQRRIASHG